MYKNSASFALYPQHDAMFNVEQDLFLLSVVSDKCMQCVTVGDPTNQAWIRRQWNNSISLDATGKNGESELKLLSVVNYYISRCLKQLLLNLILIQNCLFSSCSVFLLFKQTWKAHLDRLLPDNLQTFSKLTWFSLKDCFEKVHVMLPTMIYYLHMTLDMFMLERHCTELQSVTIHQAI